MKDYLSSFELSSALIGLNPSVEKDIKLIEQASSATILMSYSPLSLRTLDSLKHIDYNIALLLEKRSVLELYDYVTFQDGNLKKITVLIRPMSLKIEDSEKIKKICDEYTIISIIKFLYNQENNYISNLDLMEHRIKENIIFSNHISRNVILDMILRFNTYSIESILEVYDLRKKQISLILNQLTKSSKEIYEYFIDNSEFSEDLKQYLLDKNTYPLLLTLAEDYHILFPTLKKYIQYDSENEILIKKNHVEILYDAGTKILIQLAKFLSPEEDWDSLSIDNLFLLFSKHPSLQSEDTWPGLNRFLQIYENLNKTIENFNETKKELIIGFSLAEFLKNLNMNFDLFYVSNQNIQIPKYVRAVFPNIQKEEYLKKIIQLAKQNQEILVYSIKTNPSEQGYYLIYKYNIPRCFIENRNRRSFIHIMLKNSGYLNGIYDFVIKDNKNIPDLLKKEQTLLLKAIREWEKEQEKKNKKSFFQILIEWILNLFNIFILGKSEPQKPTAGDSVNFIDSNSSSNAITNPVISKKKKQLFKENIPENRLRKLPEKIEKAIEFIERQYNGLIWVDELSYVLNYNDIEKLSSILYYDKEQRFIEIKSLHSIKPLFIRRENLLNKDWISSTLSSLRNSSKLPHQVALMEYLEELNF